MVHGSIADGHLFMTQLMHVYEDKKKRTALTLPMMMEWYQNSFAAAPEIQMSELCEVPAAQKPGCNPVKSQMYL
jgi:hypothetical protein